MTDDQLQIVTMDLAQKLVEFEKERESIVDLHRQQNPGTSTPRQNTTVIFKKRFQFMRYDFDLRRYRSSIMSTSSRTGVGVDNLIGYVNELLQDRSLFPGLDTLLPSSWVKSEDQLLSLSKCYSPPICSLPAIHDAIVPCGVSQENVQGLLSYLHTVGSICHYAQHVSLREYVFLQPQFLIDLLKAVYHHDLKAVLTMDRILPSQRTLMTQRELEDMLTNLTENMVLLVSNCYASFGHSLGLRKNTTI